MLWILDSVYENWLKHVTARLNHVNQYTKNALKDDPALITININLNPLILLSVI